MQTEERAVAMAHFTQPATVSAISEARRWITALASEHDMGRDQRRDVVLALSEAVTNVVRHAYDDGEVGEVALTAATDGEWFTVRVADTGRGAQGPSLGLGLGLIAELADRVEVGAQLAGPGTVVLMEFPVTQALARERAKTGEGREARSPAVLR